MTEEMDKRDAVEQDQETIEAEVRPMDGAEDTEENLGREPAILGRMEAPFFSTRK